MGSNDVVQLLLARDDVNPNSASSEFRSPLSYASEKGHQRVVKLLIARGGLNIAEESPTPLDYAAGNGHLNIVQMLLATGKINPNLGSNTSIPIGRAARHGHTDVVEFLLEYPKTVPAGNDAPWRSPLSHAAENGHLAAVKALLARPDVNPDSRDLIGRSPLSYAAENGHREVVELLLACPSVDPDSRDENKRTPRLWATTYTADDECQNLFQSRRLRKQKMGEKAVSRCDEIVLNICNALLSRGAHVGAEDDEGWTPLRYCRKLGRPKLVRLLLPTGEVGDLESDDDEMSSNSASAPGSNRSSGFFPPGLVRLLHY